MSKQHQTQRYMLISSCLLLLLYPSTAHAHMMIKGMGPFVNGLLHPLTTVPHILILLGFGLLLGQHPPLKLKLKLPILVFTLTSGAGLALTMMGWLPTSMPTPLMLGVALVAGVIVVLEKQLPAWVQAIILGLSALLLGLDSAVDKGSGLVVVKTLLGTWGCFVLALYNVAFYTALCTRKKWMKIGLRVLGSWLVAISILVLAFTLKGGK